MLTHYIIVRRDLPIGVMCAMVTHAAGESAALFENFQEKFSKDPHELVFKGATAVVLEVKDEKALDKAQQLLWKHGIEHVLISENSGPFEGQFMAIGLVPVERWAVASLLEPYQLLKGVDYPPTDDLCRCTNCKKSLDKDPNAE